MRIAHIVSTYPPYYGGMGNVVFAMAQGLAWRDHEVVVFTPEYLQSSELRDQDAAPVVSHEQNLADKIAHVKRLSPSISYGNAARLPTIAKELDNFDIVHLHYPFLGTANLVRRWKLRHPDRPLVISYHMDTRAPSFKGLAFALYNQFWLPKILHVADRIIVASFDYAAMSQARGSFVHDQHKWVEIPFGVDVNRFSPELSTSVLREKLGLESDVPTILFVGGMDAAHYFKGVPVLLQALSILSREGVKFQAVFVGDGELRPSFSYMAQGLGIGSLVSFVGRVSDEDLPLYYALSDVLVLPSTTAGEAFGMVLLEAMASGVPVVASDLPGVRTIARRCGVVVPPHQPVACAKAIRECIELVPNREAVRHDLRRMAEQEFAWPVMIEKLEKVYMSLVQ
jgi:glycosyltransferase involved in cell wall biosynthesis